MGGPLTQNVRERVHLVPPQRSVQLRQAAGPPSPSVGYLRSRYRERVLAERGRSRFPKALALLRKMTPKWGGGLSHHFPPKPKTQHPRSVHPSLPPLRRRPNSIDTQGNGSLGLLGNISNTEQSRWPWEAQLALGSSKSGRQGLPRMEVPAPSWQPERLSSDFIILASARARHRGWMRWEVDRTRGTGCPSQQSAHRSAPSLNS